MSVNDVDNATITLENCGLEVGQNYYFVAQSMVRQKDLDPRIVKVANPCTITVSLPKISVSVLSASRLAELVERPPSPKFAMDPSGFGGPKKKNRSTMIPAAAGKMVATNKYPKKSVSQYKEDYVSRPARDTATTQTGMSGWSIAGIILLIVLIIGLCVFAYMQWVQRKAMAFNF
jgi:hypothetical protein